MTSPVRPNQTTQLPRAVPPSEPKRMSRWLAALCLLLVAVLSGFIWWLIRHDPAPDPAAGASSPEQSETTTGDGPSSPPGQDEPTAPSAIEAGEFRFDSVAEPQATKRCARVSYGEVRGWFRRHQCERVVRGLYATSKDGARAIVSIVVVTMPDFGEADQLKRLTDTSGTGNVSDLLRDGTVQIPGAPKVSGGSYASKASGQNVTIIEAAFFDGHSDPALLDRIAAEALRVATHLR